MVSVHCTVLYCTVLYCTVLYCTVLYCTVATMLWLSAVDLLCLLFFRVKCNINSSSPFRFIISVHHRLSALAPVLLSMRSSGTGVSSNRSNHNGDFKLSKRSSSPRNRGDDSDLNSSRSNSNRNSVSKTQRNACSATSNIDRLNKIKRDSCYEDVNGLDRDHHAAPQGVDRGHLTASKEPPSITRDVSKCGMSSDMNSLFTSRSGSGSGSGVRISGAGLGEVEKEGEKEHRRYQQLSTSLLGGGPRRDNRTVTENLSIVDTQEDQVIC